jgi:hypothetical protein
MKKSLRREVRTLPVLEETLSGKDPADVVLCYERLFHIIS